MYVHMYVRVCVLQFRVHTYVHNARALDCLFVRSVTWLWVLHDAVCAIQFWCTYFVCRCHFHLPAGHPVWGNGSMTPEQPRCLRRHGGSHDCSTSGIERLWGLLWSACMYVRTYIPTSTPIFCLLAFWVAQRHMGVLSQSHSTHTYVRTCMYIVVAELYNSQACQISFTKSFQLSFCQNMCLEYCTNAYLVLTLGTFQTTIYLFSTIF